MSNAKRKAAKRAAEAELKRRQAGPAPRRACNEFERAHYLGLDGADLPDFSKPGAPNHNPYLNDGDIYAAQFADDAGGGP